jgi:hypothetical protein
MLKMNGAVPPLSLHAFAVGKETNLSLHPEITCVDKVGIGDTFLEVK